MSSTTYDISAPYDVVSGELFGAKFVPCDDVQQYRVARIAYNYVVLADYPSSRQYLYWEPSLKLFIEGNSRGPTYEHAVRCDGLADMYQARGLDDIKFLLSIKM